MSSTSRVARLLLLGGLAAAATAAAAPPASHCHAGEATLFSCKVGRKLASLCGAEQDGALRALAYRFGMPGTVELEYQATPDNGKHFDATVSPAAPRAQVRQVWFDRSETRYLMTVCVGGDCPNAGGLAVLRKNRILMNAHCSVESREDQPWFSDKLVRFSQTEPPGQSMTRLLKLVDDEDNPVELLYPVAGSGDH